MRALILAGALLFLNVGASSVLAQEPTESPDANREQDSANLDEGGPLEIEDTRPLESGRRQAQVFVRHGSGNGTEIEPQFQFGLARDSHFEASLPFRLGGDTSGNGDTRVALFRRFKPQIGRSTGFALLTRLQLPTGRESSGVDPSLKFIADRAVSESGANEARLLFNVTLGFNASRLEDERSTFGRVVAGYARNLGPRTTLLFDVLHEQERGRDDRASLAEAGVHRQFRGGTLLGVGAGLGLDSRSPNLTLRASFEREF